MATAGCFALFSLDGYGPLADPSDASLDGDAPSVDAAGGGDGGDASPQGRTIFVTSATFTGDLGMRDGAHAKCQAAAAAAGLPGTYRAWLSELGSRAVDELVQDAGPLRLTSGVVVASDAAELARSGPRTAIVLDERGMKLGGGSCNNGLVAWTGPASDGGPADPSGADCQRWRSSGAAPGLAGPVGAAGAAWAGVCSRPCGQKAALYCIQQ